ncbi:hypothetical protein IF1G_00045 [Cordyceps javanica]|uniref:Uncharacterized protein n=1 Tax=Cordyceps javanica TaxID=43265 RepID=A0A545VEG2_9HYPO|nr:hypothetical protein IF1G_00045 [Cordyceps javanica]
MNDVQYIIFRLFGSWIEIMNDEDEDSPHHVNGRIGSSQLLRLSFSLIVCRQHALLLWHSIVTVPASTYIMVPLYPGESSHRAVGSQSPAAEYVQVALVPRGSQTPCENMMSLEILRILRGVLGVVCGDPGQSGSNTERQGPKGSSLSGRQVQTSPVVRCIPSRA